MNPAAQKLTGWALENGRSRHVDEVVTLVNGDDPSRLANPVIRVLSEGMILGLSPHTCLVSDGGERVPVDVSAAPVRDDNDAITGVVLVLRDVTAQRRMADGLRQSQKLEAVGRLAGGVAHEFNNQMTIVLGVSEFVMNDTRLPQELRLAGITTLEHANRFLRERYIAVQSKVRGASCSPGQGVSQVRTQGLGLDFFGPDVAEQELDLLQLSAGQMAERGATATQIMWGQLVNRSVNGSLLLRADFCASPRVHNLYKLLNGGISCPCYRQES